MKSAEIRVDRFLASSETAFAIPVHQRNFDWTHRHAVAAGKDQQAQRIYKTHLINEFAEDTEKLKLKPTDSNKVALAQILGSKGAVKAGGYSLLIENFRFFQARITDANFDVVQRGLPKLIFVDIALDRQKDNPPRIFESLSSTDPELSQADLIRNYFLMGLSRKEQEQFSESSGNLSRRTQETLK
jgi:uncharacterized protein with ParB-like and HNH nuclease domain